ncbi:MAG: hypothetical protein IPO09_16060 [Anaeromyxobacter sp.]|nr:hypothetical protein [Anaeromyxobacter sp.]MBL0276125.1 hypothetical protein [Anaeromyxobacter sp.]
MTARRFALVALLLAAACTQTSTRPGIRLDGPSAVAVFQAVTTRDAALRAYVAIANERGGDLRLLDAIDGAAVLAPGLILSLSVPTHPRPALLASGSLFDATPGADLLAVAPAGSVACDPAGTRLSGCVQVVATWTPATAVASALTLDLGELAGEGETEVLALAILPVPEELTPGVVTSRPGRARLVAGLAGGRLLVADFRRAADGLAIELDTATFDDPAAPGTPLTRPRVRVHELGFSPRSLSASPDLVHLYAATLDPIGAVEGVAELDLSSPGVSDPSPGFSAPVVRAFDAGAPTTVVLAARVREFLDTPLAGTTVALTPDSYGEPVLRVYAALDPARCGPAEAVACGIITFDPALGARAPDPAGELPYRAPMPVPGTVLSLTAIYPPAWGGADLSGAEIKPPAAVPPLVPSLQKLAVEAGERWTSTLAAVGSTTGFTYLADLGHFGLVNAQWMGVAGANTTPAQVFTVSLAVPIEDEDGVVYPEVPANVDYPRIGAWNDVTPRLDGQGNPAPVINGLDIRDQRLISVTPGYTQTEDWRLTFEGALPGLDRRQAEVAAGPGGLEWLAVQAATGLPEATDPAAPTARFRGVARLYDVRLGVQPGDVVRITPTDAACAGATTFEVRVADLLPPDTASHPGGAVSLTAPAALPACFQVASPTVRQATVTIRSRGLVLTGTESGYAGRPVLDVPFSLRHEDEASLPCPMLESPAWPPAACDAACRATCERRLLARKARRFAYVTEKCPTALTDPPTDPPDADQVAKKVACETRWTRAVVPVPPPLVFPNPTGEVLSLRPGLGWDDSVTTPVAQLRRGTVLFIQARSGFQPATRRPTSGGTISGDVFPAGHATFDRSAATLDAAAGQRVFGAYPGNLLLDFTPSSATVTTYR